MIEFLIFAIIAIRMVLVSVLGFRAVVEATSIDKSECYECLQRENFFLNVISLHKWTFKQFYPEIK